MPSPDYSSIIYNSLGVTGSQVLLYQSGYNTLGWGSGLLAIFIIDRVPRNKLVAIGTFFTTSCLVVEAALVANFKTGPNQNDSALKAAVAMNFCYIVSLYPLSFSNCVSGTDMLRHLPNFCWTERSMCTSRSCFQAISATRA